MIAIASNIGTGQALLSIRVELYPMIGVGPWVGQWSGCGFDREPGVAILELLQAHVTQSGVETMGIVDLVDKSRKIPCDVGEGFVCHRVASTLSIFNEALRLVVVVRIAAPAHRADQAFRYPCPPWCCLRFLTGFGQGRCIGSYGTRIGWAVAGWQLADRGLSSHSDLPESRQHNFNRIGHLQG